MKNSKIVYDQSGLLHRYFLDWRYKLLAGFIVIISAIGYFIFTWLEKPENFSLFLYILICCIGIIVTLVFALLNHRVTGLIWKCQNVAYVSEKDLGIKEGLYKNLLTRKIRINIDRYRKLEKLPKASLCDYFNPLKHTGAINCFFILVFLAFISLFFLTGNLIYKKCKYDYNQKLLMQERLNRTHRNIFR